MTHSDALRPAFVALEDCEADLRRLDATCCDPGRSPQMGALATALAEARTQLRHAADTPLATADAVACLEEAGAQIGRLQIGCCAPKRMPLYARMLESLTVAQLTLNGATRHDH